MMIWAGELIISANIRLSGGVKLEMFKEKDKAKALFYSCFHTAFIPTNNTLVLTKQYASTKEFLSAILSTIQGSIQLRQVLHSTKWDLFLTVSFVFVVSGSSRSLTRTPRTRNSRRISR